MSATNIEVPFNVIKLLQVWTILLTFSPSLSGYKWAVSTAAKTNPLSQNLAHTPVFDDFLKREIDANVGQTLLLPCTVRFLGDKVVSWIRSKDLHILTSGPHTFSSDNRFEPVHSHIGDFWGLRIRGVQVSDTGQYECQVNTDPKMSFAIYLTVTVPGVWNFDNTNSKWVGQALIKGPREVYVRDGSPVTFTCEISPLSVAPLQSGAHGLFTTTKARVRWLHDRKEIPFDSRQTRVTVESEFVEENKKLTSTLRILNAKLDDTGQYICMQPSIKPDSVKLFIEEGEHSEAMQRDYPIASKTIHYAVHWSNVVLLLLFHIHFIVR